MMSVRKTLLTLTVIIATMAGAIALSNSYENLNSEKSNFRIAICPTCYRFENVYQESGYTFIRTKSTAESLNLLANKKVEYVFSGRIPKPNEDFNYKLINQENSYSFIAEKSKTILDSELSTDKIYTDQPILELSKIFGRNNYVIVDNVYDYLDQGIAITSWENTDYNKAETVHIFLENGDRNPNSRTLVIYTNLDNEINEEVMNLVDEIY